MGVKVGGEEAREEADLFARYEDEGDDGDQPHISPARSQRGDPDIIGSSSMMPPMHASHPAGSGAPHTSPSTASPGPFFHVALDEGTLQELFAMIRAPDTVVVSQAASYRAGRDQRLDPSSSAFVHRRFHSRAWAQYGTPPAYYDFLSGPSPTPQQDDTAAREPSPPPRPQRPTRTVRPPRCGTGGHLRQGGDDC
ncbi:hypothetical protein PIB30_072289 [Stylosanthes scabra]|uniref:Uncharacterized protein n=1 Tax=Stylosanthes scabra TaxID=79078 RepID=A0ABU6SP59_9FABA|nr:hypothetical protein [Stylosanthes scabra]